MKKGKNLKKTPKNIYFSDKQLYLGGLVADRMGLKFSEWVQYLVTKDIEINNEYLNKDLQDYDDKLSKKSKDE